MSQNHLKSLGRNVALRSNCGIFEGDSALAHSALKEDAVGSTTDDRQAPPMGGGGHLSFAHSIRPTPWDLWRARHAICAAHPVAWISVGHLLDPCVTFVVVGLVRRCW